MTDKCEFCKGTKVEPGQPDCVWCDNTGRAGHVRLDSAAHKSFRDAVTQGTGVMLVSSEGVEHVPLQDFLAEPLLTDRFVELNMSNYGQDDVDDLQAWAFEALDEITALRTALEHIEKTCGQSRTVTRRLRWIAKRAELVLAGRPYVAAEHELPARVEAEHFKLLRQKAALKERNVILERLVRQFQEVSYGGFLDDDHLLRMRSDIDAALKPTESGDTNAS